jgi:hypothetical protein
MTCPKPEVLSQWSDGTLDPRESSVVSRHAETCAACRRKAEELRAVGAWIASAGEPGPACLSADDMAAVLEGGRVPAHVRTCPRCASEFRSLRGTERKGTRRRHKPQAPVTAWAAAAAIFFAVGVLLVVANQQTSKPEELAVRVPVRPSQAEPVREPAPPAVTIPAPKPPQNETRPAVIPDPLKPVPQPPAPVETLLPSTVVIEPKPVTPKTGPADPVRPTIAEPVRATAAALNVRSGGLALLADGKWVKPSKIEEGMALRAEGRTQLDFAQARITLDGASRFTVSKDEFTLNEGGMSAEVATDSKFTLLLDEQRIVPQTFSGRVMFCARPDRIVVEEGSAKVKDLVLHEGVEHVVKKDRVEAQKRRTLPAAARARETLTWRMNLLNEGAVRKNIGAGHIVKDTPESRMLVSDAVPNGTFFYGQSSYYNGGEEQPLFTVKPNTAIRFHYYLTQPGILELVLKNATKDENFNKPLEPVVRQWTTVTLYARDVPANRGGKNVTCEVGDRYTGVTWFAGKPGVASEVYIDRFEILEIDR